MSGTVHGPRSPRQVAPTSETSLLHVLQHALGRDEYGRSPKGDYRNHFIASEDSSDIDTCREAVAAGLMREFPPRVISGGDPIFVVTDAGKAYVATNSPRPPVLTRGQQRYRAWLAEDSPMPFGEWLRARGTKPKPADPGWRA